MKIKVTDCKKAEHCMECIKICPLNVLILKPVGTKKMVDYVKKWEIKPIFKSLCNGCMKCVEVCPGKYIKVKF